MNSFLYLFDSCIERVDYSKIELFDTKTNKIDNNKIRKNYRLYINTSEAIIDIIKEDFRRFDITEQIAVIDALKIKYACIANINKSNFVKYTLKLLQMHSDIQYKITVRPRYMYQEEDNIY